MSNYNYGSGSGGSNGYGSGDYGSGQYGSSGYGSGDYGSSQYGSGDYGSGQYGSGEYGSGGYGSDPYGSYGQGSYGSYGSTNEPTGYVNSPSFNQPPAFGQPNQVPGPGYGYPAMAYTAMNPPRPSVGFGRAIKLFFKNYVQFYGRASRSEFWWIALAGFLLMVVTMGAYATLLSSGVDPDRLSGSDHPIAVIVLLVMSVTWIATIIPSISLTVRRLHDAGLSGFLVLLNLLPYAQIATTIMCCLDSKPAGVKYDNPNGTQPAVD